jgi:hypothetical protein
MAKGGGVGQLVLLFFDTLYLCPPLRRGLFPPVLTTGVNCVAVVVPKIMSVDLPCHCTVLYIEQPQHFVVCHITRSTCIVPGTVTRLIGRYYCSQN